MNIYCHSVAREDTETATDNLLLYKHFLAIDDVNTACGTLYTAAVEVVVNGGGSRGLHVDNVDSVWFLYFCKVFPLLGVCIGVFCSCRNIQGTIICGHITKGVVVRGKQFVSRDKRNNAGEATAIRER